MRCALASPAPPMLAEMSDLKSLVTLVTAAGIGGHANAAMTGGVTNNNAGTAQPGLMLADVLDRATPGQLIAVLLLADGATLMLLRTTAAIASYRPKQTVQELIKLGKPGLSYASFLTWRNMLQREPPRRPDPERPADGHRDHPGHRDPGVALDQVRAGR